MSRGGELVLPGVSSVRNRRVAGQVRPDAAETDRVYGGQHLGRLGYLARLQAAGADVHTARSAVIVDSDLLQVGIEASLRRDHRVTAAMPERRALTAGMTDLGHSLGQSSERVRRPSGALVGGEEVPIAGDRHRRKPGCRGSVATGPRGKRFTPQFAETCVSLAMRGLTHGSPAPAFAHRRLFDHFDAGVATNWHRPGTRFTVPPPWAPARTHALVEH